MENRSFDHLLGWLPGADGKQAGLTLHGQAGGRARDPSARARLPGLRLQRSRPRLRREPHRLRQRPCDGWLRAGKNDVYCIGYYAQQDLPFLGAAAPAWTVCDRYFASIMGPTMSNRMYLHCRPHRPHQRPARAERAADDLGPPPRARDQRAATTGGTSPSSRSGARGTRGSPARSRPTSSATAGRASLPAVAYVDPAYTLPLFGVGTDYHPPSDIRAGEWFLSQVYNAVTSSPAWPRTLLVITFDEWGGFFEHVPPPRAPDIEPALHAARLPRADAARLAVRAARPCRPRVYDHASILKLIAWRFGLPALSVRDATAANLALGARLLPPRPPRAGFRRAEGRDEQALPL